MHDAWMTEPSFAKILLACDDASSLRLKGGNWFIRKLPGDRSLGYLHKLHTPLTHDHVNDLEVAIGRDFPTQFSDFLQWSNGASLFDNRVYLYGRADSISRGISPDKQMPISLGTANLVFSAANQSRWQEGWMLVGSVVGQEANYNIELHTDGMCAITSDHGTYSANTFQDCLTTIIDRIGACFSCDGIIDDSYAELHAAVASVLRPQ
jgi:hypothetical protein